MAICCLNLTLANTIMKFGDRLKKLRETHSISGYRLGVLTNRPRQFISNIENGHRPPPDSFLNNLADVESLHIGYDELKAWALEDKYTRAQIKLARNNFVDNIGNSVIQIPLLSTDLINDVFNVDKSLASKFIVSNDVHSERAFAVNITERGLAPKLESGDVVIVEPVEVVQLKNNYIYVFLDSNNECIARIVEIVKGQIKLYSLNSEKFSNVIFNEKNHKLLGQAVESFKTNLFVSKIDLENLK